MPKGTLKWFSARGFTVADDGDAGTLLHSATVESTRFGRLSKSERIEHDLNRGTGRRLSAVNLRPVN